MSNISLGDLERVEDLREVWANEAGGFTPWLAQEKNLQRLSDAIGIDLELDAEEKPVGPFRADILCKDAENDEWVVIENQLERTDHKHLGQLLTYAAGLKAVTIIWIAAELTDEHRAALDWLNEITSESFKFFGLEIELWKIGGSPVAPKFNIACKPNDWTKTVVVPDDRTISNTKLVQREYWTQLSAMLKNRKSVVVPRKPRPQHWTTFRVGRSKFHLAATVNTNKHFIRVGLICRGPSGKAHFHLLLEDREEIEREIGFELDWEELPHGIASRIAVRKRDVDPANKDDWVSQREWLVSKLEAFFQAFSPRVKNLVADDYDPDDTEADE